MNKYTLTILMGIMSSIPVQLHANAYLWVHNKTSNATISDWYLTVIDCDCVDCAPRARIQYNDMEGHEHNSNAPILYPGQRTDADVAHGNNPCFVMPISLKISGGKYTGKSLQFGHNVPQHPKHVNVYVYDNYVDITVNDTAHYYSDTKGNPLSQKP